MLVLGHYIRSVALLKMYGGTREPFFVPPPHVVVLLLLLLLVLLPVLLQVPSKFSSLLSPSPPHAHALPRGIGADGSLYWPNGGEPGQSAPYQT